ncbi:hypothetical protein Gotur_030471, partial [Gossypium turneri]
MWANELEYIHVRCRLEGYFFVESEIRKGGLVLLWKEMVDLEDVVWLLDKKAFEDLITILWNGWNCRNNAIFRDKDEDARVVNVDVAVFNNKTSFGVIIHDSDGFVLGDNEGYREELMSVEWAKLDLLIEGITLAHSLNFDMVIFESNCASLVNHFRKHRDYITLLGHRVKDSKGMIDLFVEAGVMWIAPKSGRCPSFGVIIHDSDGFVLGDNEGYREELMSVEWAELDALIEGITLAHSLNFDMVIFESNCASLVNHFRKHRDYITLLGHRVNDSRGMIDLFVEAGVMWIGRDSNKVADKLCYITLNNYCNLPF